MNDRVEVLVRREENGKIGMLFSVLLIAFFIGMAFVG